MSRAVSLRNKALKLAKCDSLNLLSQVELPARIAAHLAALVKSEMTRAGENLSILLVGGCTPGLVAGLRADSVLATTTIHVLKQCSWEASGLGKPAAHADATPENDKGDEIPHLVYGDLSDYALDPGRLEQELALNPPSNYRTFLAFTNEMACLKEQSPWIPDDNTSIVVQDFTANLLKPLAWCNALKESFRVLKPEGVLYVIGLASDETQSEYRSFAWGEGGLLSNFPQERELFGMIEATGFHGISLHALSEMPLVMMEGKELRVFAVTAYKGKAGVCHDQGHAVVYCGPWKTVTDDEDHIYRRGARTAVCAKTYDLLHRDPYRGQFIGLPAYDPPALADAPLFDCNSPTFRDPKVSKGERPVGKVGVPPSDDCSRDADMGVCCAPEDNGSCC